MFGVGTVHVLGPDGKPRWPGATATDLQTGEVFRFDKDYQGLGWWPASPLAESIESPGVARIDRRIYAVGGRGTQVLDLDAVSAGWQRAAPPTKDLRDFCLVEGDGRLLLLGGRTADAKVVNTDVFEYDPDADAWTVR
jgi:N-acetylneuraminic acid mutarotase